MLRLFSQYVRCNLSAGMAYRGAFLTQVFGMALNNCAFIVFWLILFERIGGDIRGYELGDVMFLWALAAVGYGFAAVFLGNTATLSQAIYSGDLDVYLLQPKPVLPNFAASRMSISGWGDILYGVILFAVSQPKSPGAILLFVLFSVLMAFVFTAFQVLWHSLTFFLGNAEELAHSATDLVLSFSLYPGSIFEGPTVWILHSLIPAALMAYIPVRLFRSFSVGLMAVLVAADALLIAIAVIVFRAGLRRYESGNRIGSRL